MPRRFWIETLGCPKNQVDSDKLVGTLLADGLAPAEAPGEADLIVVNTCAFIEDARQESIDTILQLDDQRRAGSQLVVSGCLAERYGDELAEALPEVDLVAPFGVPVNVTGEPVTNASVTGEPVTNVSVTGEPVTNVSVNVALGPRRSPDAAFTTAPVPSFDLLNLPRPAATAPWAYVKIAEGCDRACGFCAIPSFRGPQRSRTRAAILAEVEALGVQEVVLVAQDLASYGRDQGRGERGIVPLVAEVARLVPRVRLLYLYPSDLTDGLVDAICATGVPYFDLSLQHVSPPLLRRMRRWGDGERFLARIADIRRREPAAAFRSNFIVGYPGETEADHDRLLRFVEEAQLDWCGFFAFSREEGTYAAGLDGGIAEGLVKERLAELSELQDAITATCRDRLIGTDVEVLVDDVGVGRTFREAPEIDGIVEVPTDLEPGTFASLTVTAAAGPDLVAVRCPEPAVPVPTTPHGPPGSSRVR